VPFKVLAIDGGGIRGVIPALVLHELEQRAGRPVHELFDLIVGTSTGALLALGLTTPDAAGRPRYAAEDLVRLYLDEGPGIFSRGVLYRVRSGNGLLRPRYPAAGLEGVLERTFGTTQLSELLGDVLVTAYETEQRDPFLFRSRRARDRISSEFLVADVARAATAAPTFFPPVRVEGGDGARWTLIDGGVYANNPTMVAVVEAISAYERTDILSVSVGTGDLTRPLPYRQIRGWGPLRWARPLIDVVFDGVASTADFQAERLARQTPAVAEHLRLDIPLTSASDDIDDTSPGNLRALQDLAATLVRERSEDIGRVAELLAS
jgi:patatin-like phospholipase/acyl hydrolase